MSQKINFRYGTAADATANNPTLGIGEPGYETDTGKIKIGDGSTAWNSLPYFTPPAATATRDVNTQTGDYTLVLTDAEDVIVMNKATGNTLTVPTNASVAFPVGTIIYVIQFGTGTTTIAGAGGVTVNTPLSLNVRARYCSARLTQVAIDSWVFDTG